ncbi:hypothetical protein [Paraburkholderia youngii]|uniref:hypothetical protein n=1 Tax=Paraburkholderia youngii TaxID=2782701 RepID=UPI00159123FE|nr:hypothetical protein [Paraburkholderia youngii]NUX58712.1 hypothetical protein [Paraburkholderia youngii]
MNKARRKEIARIIAQLSGLRDDLDNMLQLERDEDALAALETASDGIELVMAQLEKTQPIPQLPDGAPTK